MPAELPHFLYRYVAICLVISLGIALIFRSDQFARKSTIFFHFSICTFEFVDGDLVGDDCGVEAVGQQQKGAAKGEFEVADHEFNVFFSGPN